MFSKKAIFLLVVFYSFNVKAVTKSYLDSLLKVVNTSEIPHEKLYPLYSLSFEYGMLEPRLGIKYGFECLRLAVNEKSLTYQLNAYNGIANCYETMSKFDSAKFYHQCSYEAAVKMAIPAKIALASFNMALCSKQLGDYRTALSEYLQAYRIMEKEQAYNPRIHFYMSEIYMRVGDYKEAEFHARKGISKCEEFNQFHVTLSMCVNLAKCLINRNDLDSALIILNNALIKFKQHTDDVGIALSLNTLGEIYKLKRNFNVAKDFFLGELSYQERTGNQNGMLLAYVNVANCLAHISPLDKASVKSYLRSSVERAAFVNGNSDALLEWYKKLSETQEAIGDFSDALISHRRYFQLYDSLMNHEKVHQLLELQTKYETEKKEIQIKILEQSDLLKSLELKSQEQSISRQNYFIFSGLIIFLMFVALAFVFLQKQKQKALFERNLAIKTTEEKERIRMAKDIHDDLGSGLSKINFLSEIIAADSALAKETKDTTRAVSETAQKLIVNMRDLIWALDPGNVSLDGLVSRLREYSSDYMDDYPADFKFVAPDNIPEKPITKEAYRSILMAVKESLNNVVKHSQAKNVMLRIEMEPDKFSLTITDNGIGTSSARSNGNGLNNMRARIESIGGEFEFNGHNGTRIGMNVPLEKMLTR